MIDPIVVRVDPDLHELVPDFLRNRHDDVRVLRDAPRRPTGKRSVAWVTG